MTLRPGFLLALGPRVGLSLADSDPEHVPGASVGANEGEVGGSHSVPAPVCINYTL